LALPGSSLEASSLRRHCSCRGRRGPGPEPLSPARRLRLSAALGRRRARPAIRSREHLVLYSAVPRQVRRALRNRVPLARPVLRPPIAARRTRMQPLPWIPPRSSAATSSASAAKPKGIRSSFTRRRRTTICLSSSGIRPRTRWRSAGPAHRLERQPRRGKRPIKATRDSVKGLARGRARLAPSLATHSSLPATRLRNRRVWVYHRLRTRHRSSRSTTRPRGCWPGFTVCTGYFPSG